MIIKSCRGRRRSGHRSRRGRVSAGHHSPQHEDKDSVWATTAPSMEAHSRETHARSGTPTKFVQRPKLSPNTIKQVMSLCFINKINVFVLSSVSKCTRAREYGQRFQSLTSTVPSLTHSLSLTHTHTVYILFHKRLTRRGENTLTLREMKPQDKRMKK